MVDDEVFYKKLAFDIEFPQLLYVVNSIVQSTFKLVPMDDQFSEMYYEHLLSIIDKFE